MNPVRIIFAVSLFFAVCIPVSAANAQDVSAEVAELRQMMTEMRNDYERRISELEERLDISEQDAIDQSSAASAANTFNPAIGVVLNGGFADVESGWDERALGGLGIYLVKEMMDEVTYTRENNQSNLLVLEKNINNS